MKTPTLTFIIVFTTILFGCAEPRPRTSLTSTNNVDSKNITGQPDKTLAVNKARIYPYKAHTAVVTTPLIINVPTTPTTIATNIVTPKVTKVQISKPNIPKVAVANVNKTKTPPKSNSKTQATKPQTQVAIVTKPTVPLSPVAALLKQAETQRAAGDLVKAAATLERGVRIEPRNPRLWNKLASIRLQQGLHSQAQSMAAKSNSLASDSPQLLEENKKIISEASKKAGH